MQEEDMVSLEELMLREDDGMDEEVTDIKSTDNRDKREDDDIEILIAYPQILKQVRVE